MYQAELCKSHVRGRLVTTEVLFTALGIAVAYFFAFGMNFVGGAVAWRLPIAAQILPAVIISIVLFGLPETPRWLIERGRIEEATQVMCQVYGTGPEDEYIVAEKAAIIEALEIENANPFRWTHVLRKDRVQTGWRVWLAVLALTFNQWSGINVIVFYIGTVLEVNVGLPRSTALVAGGCMNLAFAVGSLVPAVEAFGGPTAQIIVGPSGNTQTFNIHKKLLCDSSAYFKAALNNGFAETTSQKITLDDEDPAIFHVFAVWLHDSEIVLHPAVPAARETNLLELYLFADKRGIINLANDTITVLASFWVNHRIAKARINWIFDEILTSSELYRLILDSICLEFRDGFATEDDLKTSDLPKSVLVDLLVRQRDYRTTLSDLDSCLYSICHYHVHGPDGTSG
ncbi:hypothetical protein D6D08_10487 [Aureobasidium pullulans]|nr:hypothetical protein D6D08_10487 [Aureobasidium pullulans]